MAESFDAYRKWLGIPPEEQPPHHYRLLGISLFESDPEVIAHAADQRMAHVKTFAAGKHAALSQTILNELSAARVCLLNPEAKAVYDEHLRSRFRSQPAPLAAVPVMSSEPVASAAGSASLDGQPLPVAGAATSGHGTLLRAAPVPVAGGSPSDSEEGMATGAVVARRPVLPRRRRGSPVSSVVVVVVLAVLAGVAIAVSTNSRQAEPPIVPSGPTTLVDARTPSGVQPSGTRSTARQRPAETGSSAADPRATAATAATEPATAEPGVGQPDSEPSSPETPPDDAEPTTAAMGDQATVAPEPSSGATDSAAAPSEPTLGPPGPGVPAETVEPRGEPASAAFPDPAQEPVAAASAAASGLPEPIDAEKKRAEGIIRQTFPALGSVTQPAAKVSLADELIKLARETRDDAACQFMAFRMAGDLLAEAGQMQRAVESIDELDERFAIDASALKLDVLRKGAEAAFGRSGTEAAWTEALDTARVVADDALAAAQLDTAQQVRRIAATAAG